eukprot:s721_g13.t4
MPCFGTMQRNHRRKRARRAHVDSWPFVLFVGFVSVASDAVRFPPVGKANQPALPRCSTLSTSTPALCERAAKAGGRSTKRPIFSRGSCRPRAGVQSLKWHEGGKVLLTAGKQWGPTVAHRRCPKELLASSLVRVGSHHGLLVAKNGVQAVHGQRDDFLPTQPELLHAIKSAEQARAGLRAPCPPAKEGSPSCRSWCRRIVPGRPVEGRLEGSCLRNEGSKGPRCLCQEEAETLASCLMHCEATEASKDDAPAEPRYLLYDTRYHIGFMAQVEVFFVALELVSQLNRRLNTACKDAGGPSCQPWTLVLPPWCWVPRWYHADASRGRPWSDLFNLEGLKAEVEVRDYASLGNSAVDVGVVLVPGGRTPQLKDGHGDFLGFTKDLQACESHGQQVPQAGRKQRNSVVYSGYCDEDLAVKNLRCGVVRESSLKALVDLAENVKGRSLLVKHLDALRLHHPEGGLVMKFHHMLAPAPALVTSAKKFADVALGLLPYLGVHIRRNDFVVTHAPWHLCGQYVMQCKRCRTLAPAIFAFLAGFFWLQKGFRSSEEEGPDLAKLIEEMAISEQEMPCKLGWVQWGPEAQEALQCTFLLVMLSCPAPCLEELLHQLLPSLSEQAKAAAQQLDCSHRSCQDTVELPSDSKDVGAPLLTEDHAEPPQERGRMVAVVVVGQSRLLLRLITKARMSRELSSRALDVLKLRGISTVFRSHVLHVLQPLRLDGFIPEYLLCVDRIEGQLPPEVAQAWTFAAANQLRRMKACLTRVQEREALRNQSYSFFVRLRPDFLVLTDIPSLRTSALNKGCVLARLRAAINIAGLTNDHLSYCYCGKGCCSKNTLKGRGAGFIVDDMLAVAARDLFLRLWQSRVRKESQPRSWPVMAPMAETGFTTTMLQKRIPVCPLAFRGLPLGSSNNGHAVEAAKCGYVEGDAAVPQTSCGPAKAVTTPSATAAASRINRLLKKRQLEQVFVAGDADEGFRADLRSGVKVALYFFSQDDGAELPELRGQEELVELQLASQAEYFIGSAGSAFSAAVRRQRQRLGHPPSASDEVFCANLTAETSRKRCAAE